MKIGVYNHKSIVDLSGVLDYLRKMIEKSKESYEKDKGKRRYPRRRFEHRLSRMNDAIGGLDEQYWDEEDCFEALTRTFREFAMLDEFPMDLGSLFYREREIRLSSGGVTKRRFRKPLPNIFGSRIMREINDVVSIEKKHVKEAKWLFDVVTIKKSGLSAFRKVLQDIPPLKKRMKILKERSQFSTRYAFRPYPLAIRLWLQDSRSIAVPPDLESFLQGGIRYFFSSEFRTSIVLSAITVESVLADLYEEKIREPAPDTPLGDLFQQVKVKIDFPQEIVNAIEITNKSRIAAVHRSRFPVSDREAINALYGAANFTLWYSSEY